MLTIEALQENHVNSSMLTDMGEFHAIEIYIERSVVSYALHYKI